METKVTNSKEEFLQALRASTDAGETFHAIVVGRTCHYPSGMLGKAISGENPVFPAIGLRRKDRSIGVCLLGNYLWDREFAQQIADIVGSVDTLAACLKEN